MGLQPLVYPTSQWIRPDGASSNLDLKPLYASMLSGAMVSPTVCAPWKTWILAQSPSAREKLRSNPYGLFRAPGWWAGRNAVVVPCLFVGQQHFAEQLPAKWKQDWPLATTAAGIFFTGALAATVSHPCDLVTGLLNSDPWRGRYASGRDALRELVKVRGVRGVAIACPARIAQFTIEVALLTPAIAFWQRSLQLPVSESAVASDPAIRKSAMLAAGAASRCRF